MKPPGPSPTRPVWLPDTSDLGLPSLSGDLDVDVVVIGGGLTGVLCVHELLAGGLAPERVALVEARGIAGRASGRNAGFLLADLPEPYCRVREALGERAVRLRASSLRNQRRLVEIGAEAGADWQLDLGGVLLAAASDHEESEVRASIEMLRADGFEVSWLDAAALSERLGSNSAWGGMYDPAGGGCDPAAFVRAVAHHAATRGARLYEHTPACSMQLASDGEAVIETPSGTVRARIAVLATNAWAGTSDDLLANLVRPVRAQMLSFPATDPRTLKQVVYRNHGFEYFRQDLAGRWHFGGFRQTAMDAELGTDESLNEEVQERLLEYARRFYPQLQAVEPAHR